MTNIKHDKRGVAHLVLIMVVVVIVAVIGFAGYMVLSKNKDKDVSSSGSPANAVAKKAAQVATNAECMKKYNDKDLCKFMSSLELKKQFKVTTSDQNGSKAVIEINGDDSHMTVTGDYAYESITIGKTTYTKSGDVWWKQAQADPGNKENPVTKEENKVAGPDDTELKNDKTTYKALGKEACGSLQCFKYQIIGDGTDAAIKQFVWFDDHDYLIRKTSTEDKDAGTSVQTYEYTGVKISVPSPVKELGPNQYIVPGESEPQTLPTAADSGQ